MWSSPSSLLPKLSNTKWLRAVLHVVWIRSNALWRTVQRCFRITAYCTEYIIHYTVRRFHCKYWYYTVQIMPLVKLGESENYSQKHSDGVSRRFIWKSVSSTISYFLLEGGYNSLTCPFMALLSPSDCMSEWSKLPMSWWHAAWSHLPPVYNYVCADGWMLSCSGSYKISPSVKSCSHTQRAEGNV